MKNDKLMLPNSSYIIVWALFFTLFIILYFSLAFFSLTFQSKAFSQFFNSLIMSSLLIIIVFADILMLLNTSFIQNGKLIKDRKVNVEKYLESKMFWIDIFIFGVLLLRIAMSDSFANEQSVLSVLNLIVAFKFYKIHYYGEKLKFYYFQQVTILIYEFFWYLLFLGLLCHIVGCLFFCIDSLMIEAQWYPLPQHWLIESSAMSGLYYAPVWEQYLYSFYFAIVLLSTIAYGDIVPKNPTQVAFVVFLQAFLLMIYAFMFTQIYDVITWFNRKRIERRRNKIKFSSFLEREGVSRGLKSRILAEIEYKQKKKQLNNKDFLNQISASLLESYQKSVYKHQANKFMPRFIQRAKIPPQQFNSLISEEFLTPDRLFQPVDYFQSLSDRKIFYISNQTIQRQLFSGISSIAEIAQNHRWLGIHVFITSQIDRNEWWSSEMPVNILVLKFTDFKNCLEKYPESKEIFMEQCHKIIQFQGTSQDMHKCLLCGNGYHSTLNCRMNREEMNIELEKENSGNKRRKFQRRRAKSLKIINQKVKKSIGVEYEGKKDQGNQTKIRKFQFSLKKPFREQKMWNWKHYFTQWNYL